MSPEDDALSRLEIAADEVAQAAGGGLDSVQTSAGTWVVSIEPQGEDHGFWAT